MDVSEIVDEASFRRWLEALPQGTETERDEARRWAVLLAHRAAMRVLPEFWLWSINSPPINDETSAIRALRYCIASGLSSTIHGSPIRFRSVVQHLSPQISERAINALSAATSVAQADGSFTMPLASSSIHYACGTSSTLAALRNDARRHSGTDLHLLPLWPAENPLAEEWSTIRTHPSTQSPGWRFWIDWYDRALTGQPQDWALLEKVALIDPKDWDEGEDHVNALILRMIEQHELLLETRRLKAENERLVEHLRALEQRSHNHPPELVEDLAPLRTGTTIIWAALDDAERELGKAKPDKGALRKAAEALLTATKAVGSYCLRLADTVGQGAARTAGAAIATGLGIAGLLSSMNADLATLAENLMRFAGSLLP